MDFFDEKQDAFETVVGMIGNCFALFFFLSPGILFYGLIKGTLEIKKIPALMLIATWLNCMLWFVYGYYLDNFVMQLGNGVGMGILTVYIIIYVFYFFHNIIHKLLMILVTLVVLCASFALFFFWVSLADNWITGKCAMGFNILMYAAPGQNLVIFY
jgi:hypothetical protein